MFEVCYGIWVTFVMTLCNLFLVLKVALNTNQPTNCVIILTLNFNIGFNTHTQPFYGSLDFCPWLPGWAGARRNIHPLTLILIINHPLFASSVYCQCKSGISASFFGRPYYRSSLWYSVSSVCLSSSVTFCIVAKRCILAKKCLKEWIGNQGEKVHFLVAAIFLLPVSYGRPLLALAGFLVL